MVCLGASGTVVCLWDSRSIRVLCVPYVSDFNIIPQIFVGFHFQMPRTPALPTDISNPPSLPLSRSSPPAMMSLGLCLPMENFSSSLHQNLSLHQGEKRLQLSLN